MEESGSEPSRQHEVDAIPPNAESPSPDPIAPSLPPLSPEIHPPPYDTKQTTTCRPDQTPRWKMVLEIVAGICGVALVIITLYYTRAAYRQAAASETAANAARDAVCVASRTLAANSQNNKVQEVANASAAQGAEENLRLEERAWVEFDPAELAPAPEFTVGKTVLYRLYLRNVGKTSARNITARLNTVVASPALDFDNAAIRKYQIPNKIARQNEIRFARRVFHGKSGMQFVAPPILAPGVRATAPFDVYVVLPGSESAPRPINFTYFIGRVEYDDSFGGSHWMNFCFYASLDHGDIRYCQSGNDEDFSPLKKQAPIPPLKEPPDTSCLLTTDPKK
jgi:hypothetical protein